MNERERKEEERHTLIWTFWAAHHTTKEEARELLEICEWNDKVATSMFAVFSPKTRTTFPNTWIRVLGQLPVDVRRKILENFIHFFPRDVFEALSQGLDEEDRDYLAIISIRAFAKNSRDVEFAQTLELGKNTLLPIFQTWAQVLKEMEKAHTESAEFGVARGGLKELLNQTLPNVEKTDPMFRGISEDVVNLCVPIGDNVAQTALHVAANLGEIDLVKNLLERNARLNIKDNNGNTALHVGVKHLDMVEALLSAAEHAQQLVQQVNNKKQTVLHLCTNIASLRLLLCVCPSLACARDEHGNSALHLNTENPDAVELLLAAIPEIEQLELFVQQVDNWGHTALHFCRTAESARLLLRVAPALLFTLDDDENTALHSTTEFPGVVQVLLAAIQDAGELEQFVQQVNNWGNTALHVCESAESARLLLHVCPDLIVSLNHFERTPLQSTIDFPAVTKVFLLAIRDSPALAQIVYQLDSWGYSVLHYCRDVENAQLLLQVCPSILFVANQEGNTALHCSVENVDMVKLLLKAARETGQLVRFVEQVNMNGETALHICHNAERARLLLQASPSLVFKRDKDMRTVLHSNADYPGMIDVLLAEIPDARQLDELVGREDDSGKTALHCCKEAESARMLLGVSPSLVFAEDRFGHTALHVNASCPNVVEVLLAAIPDARRLEQFVIRVDCCRQTALHLCRNAEGARLLLRICPDLLFAVNKRGESALHLNVDDADVVKELLNAAKEAGQLAQFVEQVDKNEQTALHLCKNVESARLLIEASPNVVSMKCKAGCTPLHVHSMRGLGDTCRLLLAHGGADANAVNARGQTPLHLACFARDVKAVALLLVHSARVLARDTQQRTALHYALLVGEHDMFVANTHLTESFRKDIELLPIVSLLLAQSHKSAVRDLVSARDANGRTALHYCAEVLIHYNELAEMLMMAGANGAAQDERGNTAMHLISEHFRPDMAIHLINYWGLSIRIENRRGETALDYVRDATNRAKLQHASMLSGIVTLRFAARPKAGPTPWKRLPEELFRELVSFLV